MISKTFSVPAETQNAHHKTIVFDDIHLINWANILKQCPEPVNIAVIWKIAYEDFCCRRL